jgi:hypothetical protein
MHVLVCLVTHHATIDLISSVYLIALLLYEYLITADDEITTVWQKKLTISSALFFSIRWAMILNALIQLLPETAQASLFDCYILAYK